MNINNKGENMTNLKKLGLSALAGSLVAMSAQAGEIAVTGSANVTYKTGNTTNGNTNKSFGTDKDVAFTGTGELDNGWTFTVSSLLTDGMIVSSSYTSLTMGSLGTITAGTDFGGASYKYDEEVPQAYEQTSDAQQNTANLVGNQMDSGSLVYASPSFDIGGASISFDAEYSPNASDAGANDGGQGTYSETFRKGYGLGATIKYAGLQAGAYGNERENVTPNTAGTDSVRDAFEGVWYAKYSFGPVSIGYSESYLDSGVTGAAEAITDVKAPRTAAGIFSSESMSVAFNVNENLSLSYTSTEDTYDAQHGTGGTSIADVTQDSTAIQLAYSMGAMSLKAYQMETKNPGYDSDEATENVTEIALGLAF
jgi:outer membrane protein OmpU